MNCWYTRLIESIILTLLLFVLLPLCTYPATICLKSGKCYEAVILERKSDSVVIGLSASGPLELFNFEIESIKDIEGATNKEDKLLPSVVSTELEKDGIDSNASVVNFVASAGQPGVDKCLGKKIPVVFGKNVVEGIILFLRKYALWYVFVMSILMLFLTQYKRILYKAQMYSRSRIDYNLARGSMHLKQIASSLRILVQRVYQLKKDLLNITEGIEDNKRKEQEELSKALCTILVNARLIEVEEWGKLKDVLLAVVSWYSR